MQNENRAQRWAGLGNPFRISGYCRCDNFCRPIEGERGGEAGSIRRLELRWSTLWCVLGQQQRGPDGHSRARTPLGAPPLGHPRIRDPQRSEDSRNGVTHCKHGGDGVGDKFCTPIQGEAKMLGLGRRAEAASGAEMRYALAFCALPGFRNRPGTISSGRGLIRWFY